jgi:Flp pilus assembly protein TadB
MSATRPSRPRVPERAAAPAPRDMSLLRARRREADRRRRLLRVDVGAGVLFAIVLLLATPGVAIAAIFAGLLLAACAISVALQRRAARKRAGLASPRRAARAARRHGDAPERDGERRRPSSS